MSGPTDTASDRDRSTGSPGSAASPSTLLSVDRLEKRFGLRTIISGLTFEVSSGQILAITGRNGSGKSTLMKMLAGIAEKSAGTIDWRLDGTALREETLHRHIGFVSPYLQLYGEFTAWEHMSLVQQLRGLTFDEELGLSYLTRFGLDRRRNDPIGTFSSGMTQRMKYICALLHAPRFLYLDEPMTNLDSAGIGVVRELIDENSGDRVTLVATNDADDLALCTHALSVESGRFGLIAR